MRVGDDLIPVVVELAAPVSFDDQKVETSRIKLFFELDLQEKFRTRWSGLLGRHMLSLLGERETVTTESHGGGSMIYTPDGWLSYQRKILKGKVGFKAQLNVRNLFTHNELVPDVINPDGKVAVWSIAEGRKFHADDAFLVLDP